MSVRLRRLQLAGLALVVLSSFWPAYHFRAYPARGHLPAHAEAAPVGFYVRGNSQVPAREIGSAVLAALRGPERVGPLWEARPWYPYLLVPIWLTALLLVSLGAGNRLRRRRWVGAALLLVSTGLAAFEACYLYTDYASFLPGLLGVVEGILAWALVLLLLFYRRRPDRHVGAVEAAVAGQAVLAFVHLLTLPSTMARPWLQVYELGAVARSIWLNFPPAFWVALAGLTFVFLPVYARRSGGDLMS